MNAVSSINSEAIAEASKHEEISEVEAMKAAEVAGIADSKVIRFSAKAKVGRYWARNVAGHIIAEAELNRDTVANCRRVLLEDFIMKDGVDGELKLKAIEVMAKMQKSTAEESMVVLKAAEIASLSKTAETENATSPPQEIHTTYIAASKVEIKSRNED